MALYELGPIFLASPGEKLPHEPRRLALALSGRRTATAWDDVQGAAVPAFDFFDLKGVIESLLADLHISGATFSSKQDAQWLHPMRSAELGVNGNLLGVFGELHPKLTANFALADRSVLVAELDLDALLAAVPERFAFKPIPTAPPAKRDIAVIVPAETPADKVLAEMKQAGGELLAAAELFDVYTGESIPAGTKSLAFALVYQAADRTLGEKEIEKAHQKIEGRLRHMLKAQIRGKD